MRKLFIFSIICLLAMSFLQAEANEISKVNNELSFKLLKEVMSEEENSFIAPYSITSVLSMLHSGAGKSTKKAMAEAMELNTKKPYKSLRKLDSDLKANSSEEFKIMAANSIWLDNTIKPRWGFRRVMKKYYKSEIHHVDFQNKYESARLDINKWVEEKTMDKIKDLLKPSSVTPTTRFVLTNAVYFKGQWKTKFDPAETRKKDFRSYMPMKNAEQVDMMADESKYNYYEDKLVQMVSLPYINEKSSMLIILPKDKGDGSLRTFDELLKDTTLEELYAKKSEMKSKKTRVQIPRFSNTVKYSLKNQLSELGYSNIFSSKADFTKITKKEQLVIDDIIHKTFIEVNEEGTEAAGATAAVARTISMAKQFKADKPFIYLIVDDETDTILFAGTFVKP